MQGRSNPEAERAEGAPPKQRRDSASIAVATGNTRHPLVLLRANIPVPHADVDGVLVQKGVIAGTAFFPGGWGLWGTMRETALPPMPVGGIMVVGQDFDTERGLERSIRAGHEVRVEPNGTYDAGSSPTWRGLLPLLTGLGIPLTDCFFTNAYMAIRSGTKNTGQFSGARHPRYRQACQEFFLQQVAVQRPKLIVTLGRWVPAFMADLAPQLAPWSGVSRFKQLDLAGPVRSNVLFPSVSHECCVVALTHPSYRHANVWRRRYAGLIGEHAEVAMLREGLNCAALRSEPSRYRGDDALSRIEAGYHGLIRSRVAEGRLETPPMLPPLDLEMLEEKEPRWFPIPGMYGGFAYQLRRRQGELELVAESWSRVVDGSGRRHVVTAGAVILEAEGFV